MRARDQSQSGAAATEDHKKTAGEAVLEFLKLEALHGKYPLSRFANEVGVPRMTLVNRLKNFTDEAKEEIRQKYREEAEQERQVEAKLKRSLHWLEKAEKRQQVGQDGLYLDSGVTYPQYQQAHKWGVC